MKKYNLHVICTLIVLVIINSSCDKDERIKEAQNTSIIPNAIESEFFSVNFSYSDTVQLLDQNNNYVDIVVSSDKKEVLNMHLSNNEYVLNEVNIDEENTQSYGVKRTPKLNNDDEKYVFEKVDITNVPKIRVEVLDVSDEIQNFGIKCNSKKKSTTGMQKVPYNPTPWYYEYTSPTKYCYGKLRYTNEGSDKSDLKGSKVRYGYRSCWLFCKWITWPEGDWLFLDSYTSGYLYSINSFGKDGFNYSGDKIYQLCTGVLSYSADNHWNRWNTAEQGPVPNW